MSYTAHRNYRQVRLIGMTILLLSHIQITFGKLENVFWIVRSQQSDAKAEKLNKKKHDSGLKQSMKQSLYHKAKKKYWNMYIPGCKYQHCNHQSSQPS